MSADDRAKRALELLQRALASEGTLRSGVRELRSRLGEARVKLMDEVVSTLARREVNTQTRSLFKKAAEIAAEALREASTPPPASPRPAPTPAPATPRPAPASRPAPAAAPSGSNAPGPDRPAPSPARTAAPPPPPPAAAPSSPRGAAPTPAAGPPFRPPPAPARAPIAPGVARLQLVARDPEWVYAYWELDPTAVELSDPLHLALFDADTGDRVMVVEAGAAERHVAFRRPGAGRRYVAILDRGGGLHLRSSVVEVPSVEPSPLQPVRFVAPRGRGPEAIAAEITAAPFVSPPRVLGWSQAVWQAYAARRSPSPQGSSPSSGP